MKKLIFFLLLSSIFLTGYSQTASRLLSGQANPFKQVSPTNFLYVDTTPTGMYRIYAVNIDSVKMKAWNIRWLNDSVLAVGDTRYAQLLGAYSDPAFVNSLSAAKVFGLSQVALTGNYSDLSGTPNLGLYYLNSNPAGYISGVTGPMITAALGYVPYNGTTNPNGYQSKTVQATDGVMKASSVNADTLKADWNLVMSVQRASDSINSIKAQIATKQSYSDTNTYDATRYWVGLQGYLTGITQSQITTALGYTPLSPSDTTNKWYPRNSNPNNYLTTITSSQINSALGYTPLQPSDTNSLSNRINQKLNISDTTGKFYPRNGNPDGFLTSINSGQVTTALGFTPTPTTRTLTINGLAQDLSANRTWTVGDLLSTGSYSNPSWITSLAWSKITGTPTTLAGYGITDGVTSSTLVNYATTASVTSGLAGKENTITAGTTAQYWRGDKSWQTLNTTVVPEGANQYFTTTRARTSLSAGTGITYNNTTGVITNSAPDQTVSIASGTGISVTGTYPSFTVSSTTTAPTFNPTPARTLNANYTVSSTLNARVSYTVALTTTLSLLNLNSAARVFLEYSTNGGSSWNTINSAGTSRTLSVAITIGINETTYWNLVGEIPANALVRLRSTTSGGGTASWDSGIEVTY